ncbi:hypothetical protein, partial [Stenotrophomonas maltophilia group sp. RNC7]|uniref:hypothetical protein n=1 Tax=Stenotrophomonas maltophilia group sp. RNC7 TaxID=3071467 RepID=UPI0027DEF2FB
MPKGWRSAPNWVPFSDSYFRDYDRNVQVFADEMDGIGESYGVPAGLFSGATKGVVNVGNFFMVEELRMFADPNAADGDKMLALVTMGFKPAKAVKPLVKSGKRLGGPGYLQTFSASKGKGDIAKIPGSVQNR